MPNPARLSEISECRQMLVRLCQSTNYGYIEDLPLKDGEPVFDPAPAIFLDLKPDSQECLRHEFVSADFPLCQELVRLMALLDRIINGKISKLEVRAGIPRRVVVEHRISELLVGRRDRR